jgi:hypothetical protein
MPSRGRQEETHARTRAERATGGLGGWPPRRSHTTQNKSQAEKSINISYTEFKIMDDSNPQRGSNSHVQFVLVLNSSRFLRMSILSWAKPQVPRDCFLRMSILSWAKPQHPRDCFARAFVCSLLVNFSHTNEAKRFERTELGGVGGFSPRKRRWEGRFYFFVFPRKYSQASTGDVKKVAN